MKKAQKRGKEVVPGLTDTDVREIADQIFNRTDSNRPQVSGSGNGFLNILENGKAKLSASSIFVHRIAH
jgi:hypothetical protein